MVALQSPACGVGQKVFGDDFPAVPVDFAEGDCPESCPLRCKGESADPAKEVNMSWLIHATILSA
jgi:hypothetical protein